MEIDNRRSTFIRDLVVKVLLIVLFIFLLMFLFPMPNLTPFYDSIFNNNVQSMKDAAEKWYTTERMPEKEGQVSRLTLQDMLDKKLILPFVDRDGNSCDTHKSYVTVKKVKDEYVMKVSLTCGNKTDYIIEHIGCYNFCKTGSCTKEEVVAAVETNEETGETVVNTPVKTNPIPTTKKVTPSNPTPTPSNPTPNKVVYEYEYARTRISEKWTIDKDYIDNKLTETDDIKLYSTREQYTGQKKITEGTTLYTHVLYKMFDNWTYDKTPVEEVKEITDNVKIYGDVDVYTGQKEKVTTVYQYMHRKPTVVDDWQEIGWSNQQRTTNNSVKEIGRRYVVQKTTKTTTTSGNWSDWLLDNEWRSSKPNNTQNKQWGDIWDTKEEKSSSWSDWKNDNEWRSSKPSNTSTKQWGSAWDSKTIQGNASTSWVLVDNAYASRTALSTYSADGNYKYVFNKTGSVKCTAACNGQTEITVYYYTRYKKTTTYGPSTTQYKYKYRTLTTNTTKKHKYKYRVFTEKTSDPEMNVDTQTVTDPTTWVNNGYTIIRTEYNYSINHPYETNEYKPTDSIVPEEGWIYTGISQSSTIVDYEDLLDSEGKVLWVSNKSKLGEYTHNVKTKKLYYYKYNNPYKKKVGEVTTESIIPPEGYVYEGEHKESTKSEKYVSLGTWVNDKSELGEYTYNIETRTQYLYRRRHVSTTTETDWFTSNPGGDWKPTGGKRVKSN